MPESETFKDSKSEMRQGPKSGKTRDPQSVGGVEVSKTGGPQSPQHLSVRKTLGQSSEFPESGTPDLTVK